MNKSQKKCLILITVLYIIVYLVWNKIIVRRPFPGGPGEQSLTKRHPPSQHWPSKDSGQRVVEDAVEAPSPEIEREVGGIAPAQPAYDAPVTSSHESDSFKKILFWNDAYGDPGFFFGQGHEPFVRAGCPVNSCYATHNRSLFPPEDVDALIWHLRANDKSLPRKRSPHTYYIFWMIESALYTFEDVNVFNGVFNWTFTYRMDSDFPRPYGKVERTPIKSSDAAALRGINYAEGKTKMAVWFVSNCNTVSEREILVRTLQRWVKVDVYGSCGEYNCPKESQDRCYQMMERNYKFYLSFENSLCYDYVTEKLFSVLKKNIVPVVYGLGYGHLNLPPHSYIDVLDFKSVQDLADHLLYLDQNDTAYNEYFRWKSEGYAINIGKELNEQPFCDLCERLHQAAPLRTEGQPAELMDSSQRYKHQTIAPKYHKVYKDLYKWFVANQCSEPFSSRALAAFIHGDTVTESKDNLRALQEEALLPYRIRPHKDLWD